jgi:ribose transport system ATP-binding protein
MVEAAAPPAQVASASREPICVVQGVVKHYGGVKALVGVDLHVHPATVHAIVGENGAGKSTLMKILAGAEKPTHGSVFIGGQSASFHSVRDANAQGVAIVFQELSLFPDLDTLANLFLFREPRRFGVIQRGEMRRLAQPILDELGLHIDVNAPVDQHTLAERQLIEIAKALLLNSKVLILDEPNSALNAAESERLFAIVRKLRAKGVAILYISHRLEEVFEIADVITIIRNGEVVDTLPRAATSIPQVISAMIGREPAEFYSARGVRTPPASSDGDLVMEGVSVGSAVSDVTFRAAPGEIVGLAGLEGSGVGTVLEAIFGMKPIDRGTLHLPGDRPASRTIRDAVRAGIAMVPADRRHEGLMLDQPIVTNIAQVTAGALGRLGFFLRQRGIDASAQKQVQSLNIRARSIHTVVGDLSGGNQQKVVIGKWLDANPHLVLLNDPTRGVDVGAKEEIYRIVGRLAEEGRIVLFTSTELPEFAHLCDRVIVFYRGRAVGEITRDALTTQHLLEAINTGVITPVVNDETRRDDSGGLL